MEKNILVLARRDSNEAMRVAAGLTIFGHSVVLTMLSSDFNKVDYQQEFEELLELAEIEPVTTTAARIGAFTVIEDKTFAEEMINAQVVISL